MGGGIGSRSKTMVQTKQTDPVSKTEQEESSPVILLKKKKTKKNTSEEWSGVSERNEEIP